MFAQKGKHFKTKKYEFIKKIDILIKIVCLLTLLKNDYSKFKFKKFN